MKLGWEGYGIFWALIELLRDQTEYAMKLDYESIAFALHTDCDKVKSILNDFDLFDISKDLFHSKSLLERMKIKDERSDKARESALKRWNKDINANALRTQSEPNAIKESKVKESKLNESLNEKSHNDIFRSMWVSQMWIESICIKFKSEIDDTRNHLDEFRKECILKADLKVNEKDAKNHFINWIKTGNPIPKGKIKSIIEVNDF